MADLGGWITFLIIFVLVIVLVLLWWFGKAAEDVIIPAEEPPMIVPNPIAIPILNSSSWVNTVGPSIPLLPELALKSTPTFIPLYQARMPEDVPLWVPETADPAETADPPPTGVPEIIHPLAAVSSIERYPSMVSPNHTVMEMSLDTSRRMISVGSFAGSPAPHSHTTSPTVSWVRGSVRTVYGIATNTFMNAVHFPPPPRVPNPTFSVEELPDTEEIMAEQPVITAPAVNDSINDNETDNTASIPNNGMAVHQTPSATVPDTIHRLVVEERSIQPPLMIPDQPKISHPVPVTSADLRSIPRGKIVHSTIPRIPSLPEQRCRKILEEYYRRSFDSIWHPDIVNHTDYLLELDCFNGDLKIALEYNGIQHYQWPNYTGQSQAAFMAQTKRDELKRQRCRELGIYLIVVPYTVTYDQLKSYIIARLPE
jgi:hypothetical protein